MSARLPTTARGTTRDSLPELLFPAIHMRDALVIGARALEQIDPRALRHVLPVFIEHVERIAVADVFKHDYVVRQDSADVAVEPPPLPRM